MTKAQELMKQIDELRVLAQAAIEDRRINTSKFGPNSDMAVVSQTAVDKLEAEILRLLREYWELMDESEASARKEADGMAQAAADRDRDGIKLLKELGYRGASENVIEALCELASKGYSLEKADVDVLEESIHLIRRHLTEVGIDVPFIDDCAAVAAQHIKDLRGSVTRLSIKTFETTEERDHRPYKVKKQVCRLCKTSVNVAIQTPDGWMQTGLKLSHTNDCVMKNVKE